MKNKSCVSAKDFTIGSVFATRLADDAYSVSTYVVLARNEENVRLLTVESTGKAIDKAKVVEVTLTMLLDDVRYVTRRLL